MRHLHASTARHLRDVEEGALRGVDHIHMRGRGMLGALNRCSSDGVYRVRSTQAHRPVEKLPVRPTRARSSARGPYRHDRACPKQIRLKTALETLQPSRSKSSSINGGLPRKLSVSAG